jgi:NAD(P)H-hydrate repair Nnr-like enzyme with NAD(P)H-hydrate epimerase domain
MAIKTLGAKAAAALDQELMSTLAFSIDQLMELAGLSVSQAGKQSLPAVLRRGHISTYRLPSVSRSPS